MKKPKSGKMIQADEFFTFAPSVDEAPSLHTDERIALLAVCVAHQQSAGFERYIDLREVRCASCGAPGFNTGYGAWKHTCGAEWLTDGEVAEPCPKDQP